MRIDGGVLRTGGKLIMPGVLSDLFLREPLSVRSARDDVIIGESFEMAFFILTCSSTPLVMLKFESLVERFLANMWPESGGGGGIRIVVGDV